MSTTTFTINSKEFSATLKKYMELCKKDVAFVLNDKAFRIAKAASYFTPRADYKKFAAELGLKTRTIKPGQRRAGTQTMN